MASLSVKSTCSYCNSDSAKLRAGWKISTGGFAMLCDCCASAYERGTFCEIFHSTTRGWRKCATCNKIIHCGCIMSAENHILLDLGGVKCLRCVRNEEQG